MNEHETAPAPSSIGQAPRRAEWPRWAAGTVALCGLSAAAWLLYQTYAPAPLPEIPQIELTGVEPAVERAVAAAVTAVEQNRRSAQTWGRLGMVLHVHNLLPAARPCFAAAAMLEPGEPKWTYLQATNALEDDPDAAIAERALRRATAAADAQPAEKRVQAPRLRLVELLIEQGRMDEAEAELRPALVADARNPRALLDSGRIALARGDLAKSLRDLTASANREPRARATHALLAEVQHRLGHESESLSERRLAARSTADFAWPDPYMAEMQSHWVGTLAEIRRADTLFDEGRTADAMAAIRRMASDHPESLAAVLTLGRYYIRTRDFVSAIGVLQTACERHADSTEAHLALGKALAAHGESAAAMQSFRQVIALEADHVPAWHQLARALAASGDKQAAEETYRECLRFGPGLAVAHRELGELLLSEGRTAEASECFTRAVALDPDDRRARQLLREHS